MARKQILMLLLIGGFYIGNANAIPITINANNYAPGTDISSAIAGVTLQQYTHVAYSDTITYAPAEIGVMAGGPVSYLSATQNNLAYRQSIDPLAGGGFPLSSRQDFTGLNIASDHPFSYFDYTAYSPSADPFYIMLFGETGNYIRTIDSSSFTAYNPGTCVFDCGFMFSFGVDLSAESVYRIALGSWSGPGYVNSLTVAVPEPSSLVLLSVGLLGFGILRKRQKETYVFTATGKPLNFTLFILRSIGDRL